MYPQTGAGLPRRLRRRHSLLPVDRAGTLFYSALLFGSFAWLRARSPVLLAQTA
jgi:hypothetical protein